ncbi:hypothetical protein [Methylobacterium nodulans]|uniref:Uncharacterized protein n=1 Tax=Methylobacterium nodulans (strain LMG 21967 / CNCM I-2342 / ORS 2060) TaxID=460265 RepID=B8I9N2_METNO|nr:hypothetical protein [Methylobacterium nodulans]ACL55285.1 conserved hypothetical protein [Methylobacterium nodulans ORS 2060]
MVNVVQQWNPDDWESFALSLLQVRHGILNVQKVPATHRGDFGIDFYCTAASVIYQCFAVEEPVDVVARATRQKNKITTDLRKLVDGAVEVSQLFLGVPVKKWILLVPLHDSKDVNLHCAKKTTDTRALQLAHLDTDFEVCVHDQGAFPGAALSAAISALTNLSLSVQAPTQKELEEWQAGSPNLLANATKKLSKRTAPGGVQDAVVSGVELFLKGNALVDALRSSAPDLHEKVVAAISGRARRLSYVGPQGGPAPNNIMNTELNTLINAIKDAAPTLSQANAEDIALGTLSDWIMRCPLDFPSNGS